MTEREAIRELMKLRGWSQQQLATESGFKRQSNISNLLNSRENGMRVDNLLKLVNTMGCDLVIRDKMGSKKEWIISNESEPEEPESIEQQLAGGKISFEQAVAKGWKPSPEMLSRMLGGDTK